ncbi:MAG TPA: Crp/Fnr family transcriptional regulator [Candidatus Kapabacteria bacterium]|nr:Crp/Fnr family transcriptional regulator [Candidatus Kapabacteria bacterium]
MTVLKNIIKSFMLDRIIHLLQKDDENWQSFKDIFVEKEYASKTILLNEGEISRYCYFIKKGCLRQWFNKDGKDITTQFFFEGQPVASIDSFMSELPSLLTLETIEPSNLISINRENFIKLQELYPEIKIGFQKYLFQRFRNYANLFLSRIKDSPQERYEELIKNHPEILQRIPQHYIASYLGITPVSLSRIRNRK